MTERTWDNTRAAIVEYDAGRNARMAAWENAETQADIRAAEEADAKALMKVQGAFYEDTKDINSRERCRLVDLAFARQMAGMTPVKRGL